MKIEEDEGVEENTRWGAAIHMNKLWNRIYLSIH
jgi:hypothetical protein